MEKKTCEHFLVQINSHESKKDFTAGQEEQNHSRNSKKAKSDANVCSMFLGKVRRIRQVTNIRRSKLDKLLIDYDIL